jgi:hypothetical protein
MTEHRGAEEVAAGLANPSRGEGDTAGCAAHAIDPEIASRLWTLSEKRVGQRFEF